MKNSFGIVLKDNSISVYDFDNKCYLKKGGESVWKYDESFWKWFEKKIDYQGENLSFIIATDNDNFEVSPRINLDKENKISKSAYKEFVSNFALKIKVIPHKDYNINHRIRKKQKSHSIEDNSKNITVKYYKKKTKEYEG